MESVLNIYAGSIATDSCNKSRVICFLRLSGSEYTYVGIPGSEFKQND